MVRDDLTKKEADARHIARRLGLLSERCTAGYLYTQLRNHNYSWDKRTRTWVSRNPLFKELR